MSDVRLISGFEQVDSDGVGKTSSNSSSISVFDEVISVSDKSSIGEIFILFFSAYSSIKFFTTLNWDLYVVCPDLDIISANRSVSILASLNFILDMEVNLGVCDDWIGFTDSRNRR